MADPKVLVIGGSILAVVVLAIGLISVSLKRIEADEVGLKYDVVAKNLANEATYEGLHAGPPGFIFIKFSNVFRTLTYDNIQCLNFDGVHTGLSISFQYRVRANHLKAVVLQFKDNDGYLLVLRAIGSSAIFDSCSKFNTSQYQSERGAFQTDLLNRLVEKYKGVHCDVTDMQVNNIVRPQAYEKAIKDKEAAREDIEVARNERPQALTEAVTKRKEAETQAVITVDRALSQARITEQNALSQGEGIRQQFHSETLTYKSLVTDLSLDTKGFLAYMGVRTVGTAKNTIQVGMKAPVKTNWLP